jgi:hypothetical protein
MGQRYEVLLRRDNGFNKTVIIEDCMSEREAKETAEAMYGMEVLRVLWKPVSSSDSSSSNSSTTNNSSSFSDNMSPEDAANLTLGSLCILAAGAAIWIVISLWPLFIVGGACWLAYKWWKKKNGN